MFNFKNTYYVHITYMFNVCDGKPRKLGTRVNRTDGFVAEAA